jgi:hypothetical protein
MGLRKLATNLKFGVDDSSIKEVVGPKRALGSHCVAERLKSRVLFSHFCPKLIKNDFYSGHFTVLG